LRQPLYVMQNKAYIYTKLIVHNFSIALNMKKIIAATSFCIAGIACYGQTANSFTLNGKITGLQTGKLRMAYNNGKPVQDSAEIKNGSFTFKGTVTQPVEVYFSGNTQDGSIDDPDFTSFFIEPGIITIALKEGDFKHAVITGSKTQNEAKELQDSMAALQQKIKPLSAAYENINAIYMQAMKDKKPEAYLDSLHEKAAAIHDQLSDYSPQFAATSYRFFARHPASYVTAANLRFYVSSLTLDSLKMFYNNLGASVQQSIYAKEVAKQIDQMQGGSPGAVAKNFTATDINGNKLSLANFKGKYIIVDFWASWCIPCRHSNPHLKELYAKYHDKGFDIIGVSDDDSDDTAWRKAVAKDGIGIWHHVLRGYNSDKPALNNDINEKYGVHTLPTKILIDKNGVIVGRYDKGTEEEQAEMDKRIAEVMANNSSK